MNFTLSDEQQALRDTIVRFCGDKLNDGVQARDRDQTFPRALWLACGDMGLPGLPVPADQGGAGLDPLSAAIALEAFGYGCTDAGLVFAVGAHLSSCVLPLWKFGNADQRREFLPKLCNGRAIGVHAMTEPTTGSDAFAMKTTARRDGTAFVLKGTKTFISNAAVADLVIVFAVTDPTRGYFGGVTAFLVKKDTPGFGCGQTFSKMGLRTAPLGELTFDEVRVEPDMILGQVGSGSAIFNLAMDWERVFLGAANVGVAERLLDAAVHHARTRQQFKKPIGQFQGVSHKIANMKVRHQAARLLTYQAATELERSKKVGLSAAMVKLFTSESLVETALETMNIFGAQGYVTDGDIERTVRDALGSTIYSGTSEMQRNMIARWLGL